ncbi:MAG TPA: pseudouridine synthase [Bryobacteraceae bacterium]|nr:pseudouridine synthase [Bryobacteraceae bacterium]
MPIERIQKILSRAGVSSRRKAEELIVAGQVTINGQVVTELGSKADLDVDHIKVKGKLIRPPKNLIYLMMNKPRGCVTTTSDPEGRETVMDLLRGVKERVYPVGRLDYDSEGLLLFTNDGDFANVIAHAKTEVAKIYVVKTKGQLAPEQEAIFREGVPVHGRRTAPAGLKLLQRSENPWYEVRLIEGRQNQIKLMFRHFGLLVEKLRRVKIGPLDLGSLKPGKFRHLKPEEVARFQRQLKRSPSKGLRKTRKSE